MNFKKWFENEQEIQSHYTGINPLYHGTNNPNLTQFDPTPINKRDHGWFGTGLYLTKYPTFAKQWGKHIYKIEIPQNIKMAEIHTTKNYEKFIYLGDAEQANQQAGGDEAWIENEKQWAEDFTQNLKKLGYDGVRVKMDNYQDLEVLIFDPKNAKIVGEEIK